MLGIGPLELRFAFEFNKEISNAVKLTNETGNCVAFNIKTVSQLKYYTQPNKGIVPPRSNIIVKITLQAQEKIPGYMPHADEFIVQSTKVKDVLKVEEITEEVFNDKAGKVVDKVNLTVVYDDESEKLQANQSLETNVRVSEETSLREQGTERQRLNFRPPLQTILTTNENARDLMPGTVTAMTGAMGRLLPKLHELLDKEHNLQTSVKKYFESLERQLKRMHARLYKLSWTQLDQLDEEDKVWAIEVRELSYDIEDIVDNLIVRIEHSEPITDQDSLIERVEDIMVQVKELAEWYGTYKVRDSVPTPAVISRTVDPRLSTLYKDHRELVGIDGPRDELVRRLRGKGDEASSKQQLKIISIFGEGGLGKTTLAKAVFDKLAAEFLIKAFVPVGRNPDTKRVIEDILYEIDKQTNENIHQKNLDERQLIDKLQNVLQNKRYLIVIDDIWDRRSWDTIKYGLINNDKGSRVITTSRIFEVAENSGEVCQLKPLSCDHSKELFYARLGRKGAYISDQLDDKSTKYILEKCGGLPLAIITIASLLAGKSAEEWSEVYSRIGFGQEGTRAENTKKILLFSYNDLPSHLKTCFLYLSIFPEDHMIEKNALVWKWIAEGFVHEEKGQTLFEVGERYFNELINRSMMQPFEAIGPWYEHIFETYDIWACRVHDMVHDLICSMAKEESFVTILDRNEQHLSSQNKARIVAVQNRVMDQCDLAKTCKQEVMRSFNATKCDISREALDSLLKRCQVLQVLSLKGSLTIISRWTTVDVYGLKNLARLRHLRYLRLCRTAINEQPMELGDLSFLQFLDLRETGIKALPQSVTLLRELKCLRCGTFDTSVTLPDGMGSLTSLEELRLQVASGGPSYSYLLRTKGVDQKHPLADFSTELGKLTGLRVLHISIHEFPDRLEELALVESLNKLKKLVELEVVCWSNDNLDICHGYLPCPRLRRLCLGHEIELPVWINTSSSLRNLSYLSLILTSLKPGDLNNIGSLPQLQSFLVSCNMDFCDVIAAGAFPKLRFWANNSMITYQQGAMPCLEFLQFDFHAKAYIGFDFGSLQYLPALEKVFAQIYCGDVKRKEGEAVKKALRRSIDNHPNHPTADLIKYGRYTDIIKRDDPEEVKVSPRLALLREKEKAARRAWLRKKEKALRGGVDNHGNRPILNLKIFGECSDDKFNENDDIEKEMDSGKEAD